MADNLTTQATTPATLPNATKLATRAVTYSGDADSHIQPVSLVGLSGGDDAKTAADLPGDATDGLLVNLGTNNDVVEASAAAIKTAVEIVDDWDESDRAKVNPIVGQAGIAAGAGAVGVTVPRVTLASDDPGVALLGTIDADTSALFGCVGGTELQVDIVAAPTLTVQATNLDIRDLSGVSDSVAITGTVEVQCPTVDNFRAGVIGLQTHNNGAPVALTNLGVLPAIANAAGPTYTEGNQVLLSTDLAGNLRARIENEVAVDASGTTLTVQATDLDVRDLTATDVVTVTGGAGQAADVKVTLDGEAVAGTVTANAGTDLNTSALALESGGNLATLAGAVTAAKVQVDVITMPTTTVTATNLDIRDLTSASDSVEVKQATASNLKAEAVGPAAQGAAVSGNPLLMGVEGRDTKGTVVDAGDVVRPVASRYGELLTSAMPPSHASSNGTPITATTTGVIAAPSAGNHLRVVRIHLSNGGATACWVGIRDGAAGTRHYNTYLVQGAVISLNLNTSGPLDLTTATRLDIFLSAAGSVEYEIDYHTVAD